MEKVTVTRVSCKEVESKFGKTNRYGIQTEEHGDTWFGAFANKFSEKALSEIKEGDTIKIVTSKKGDFHNFKLAGPLDLLEERVKVLEEKAGITEVKDEPEKKEPVTADDIDW